MIQDLFDKWYIENYDKSGNKQHYAYELLNEVFKAGYEAAMQVNNNYIKNDVKRKIEVIGDKNIDSFHFAREKSSCEITVLNEKINKQKINSILTTLPKVDIFIKPLTRAERRKNERLKNKRK